MLLGLPTPNTARQYHGEETCDAKNQKSYASRMEKTTINLGWSISQVINARCQKILLPIGKAPRRGREQVSQSVV